MDSSLLHIQPAAPEPIYRQIMAQIQRLIVSGQLQPGMLLPSVRDVAAYHAINPMTVSKAYSLLEAEGLLLRQRGKGMSVADTQDARPSQRERWQLLAPALDALARQACELELPPEQLAERLVRKMKDFSR